jgi:hypothetical protein
MNVPFFCTKRPELYRHQKTLDDLSDSSVVGFNRTSDHKCNPNRSLNRSKSRSTSITTMLGD